MLDVREEILRNVHLHQVTASIVADCAGIIAGTKAARRQAESLGLSLLRVAGDGSPVEAGDEVMRMRGGAKQIVMAEEVLIGLLAKPSGIATSAHRFVKAAGGRPKIVCGAWKKMPIALKEMIREAVTVGGAFPRVESSPFAYLDKNYVQLLGGIKESLATVAHLEHLPKVIQVKGRYGGIVAEACEAAECGATIVFIDTGNPDDIRAVVAGLLQYGLRDRVKLAYGGGVGIEAIDELRALDIDIVDVGRQVVDAPLLDMRLEIIDIKICE